MSIYAQGRSSGDGNSAAYSLSGPALFDPQRDGAAAMRQAEQGAVRAAGREAQGHAQKAYSPVPIRESWKVQTRTVPGILIRVSSAEPLTRWVEEKTEPHDIPNAFGWGPQFGIGGRFEGKFHPGTPGKHRLPGLLEQLGKSFERQVARRVDPLLRGDLPVVGGT